MLAPETTLLAIHPGDQSSSSDIRFSTTLMLNHKGCCANVGTREPGNQIVLLCLDKTTRVDLGPAIGITVLAFMFCPIGKVATVIDP